MDKRELREKLLAVDEDAFFTGPEQGGQVRSSVVIAGGAAVLLSDLSSRQKTKDIDIIAVAVEESVRAALSRDPDFNSGCQAYSMNVPYNFEDRLVRIDLDTRVVDYFSLSPEDLAVMKLYRWEAPDIEDLLDPKFIACMRFDLLEHLIHDPGEALASRVSDPEHDREYRQMLHNFEQYKERLP